jgi:para-nitrobenzyl esterase
MSRRFLLCLLLCVSYLAGCSEKQEGPVVKTAQGDVQGFIKENVNMFYGIPYAAPPVGDLRWKTPQPHANWEGVRKTTSAPPLCFQSMLYMQRGQEDCLYLNVATPDIKPAKPKPVMVWFHGGGFIGGDGLQGTPLQRLAARGDVVVVSLQYRVGALGFMAHPALSAESEKTNNQSVSGNYGLMDQQAALRWVRDNIGAFGGDSKNVTIFGESAGGMSVCAHLASPVSAGLFKQAIIQSGPCTKNNADLSAAEKQGEWLAIRAGCEGRGNLLQCLRDKKPEEILQALPNDPAFVFGEGDFGVWGPVTDGHILPESIQQSFQSGRFNRVPVINGNNDDEGSLMVMFSHEYRFKPLQAEDYEKRIRYLVGDNQTIIDKVKARYPLEKYEDPGAALAAVLGDEFMSCNIHEVSDWLSPWAPVYAYTFTYPDAAFVLPEMRKLGAFHSAELQFVFHAPMNWFRSYFSGDELKLSNAMMDYWSQFAHTGNPNRAEQLVWPLYAEQKNQMMFDRKLSIANNSKQEACAFWRSLGLDNRRALQQFEVQPIKK